MLAALLSAAWKEFNTIWDEACASLSASFSTVLPDSSCGWLAVPSEVAQMKWALAISRGCSASKTCSLWCPSNPSRCCEKRANLCRSLWSLAQLLTRPPPGFPAPQLCGSREQVPGAAPPAHGDAGIVGGSAAFLSRAHSLPPSSPPQALSCLSCAGSALQMPAGRPTLGGFRGAPQVPSTPERQPHSCCSRGTRN